MKTSIAPFASLDEDLAPLSVRPAVTDADRRAAATVLRQAYQPHASPVPAAALVIHLTELFDLRERMPGGVMLLARWRGRVVGAAICHPQPGRRPGLWPRRWMSVRALAVAPEARRWGVGQKLLLACAVHAREHGASALCLHVADFMTPGHAFAHGRGLARMRLFDVVLGEDEGFEPGKGVVLLAYVMAVAD